MYVEVITIFVPYAGQSEIQLTCHGIDIPVEECKCTRLTVDVPPHMMVKNGT